MRSHVLSSGAFLALALLTDASPVNAVTQHSPEPEFTFSGWVNGIIENPDGPNLSVEEAVAAAKNLTVARRDRPLSEREAVCDLWAGASANVPDAVWCINYLAGLGQTPCVIEANAWGVSFCSYRFAEITGGSRVAGRVASACNDVARAGGFIMDRCTKPDDTVQGYEYAYGNGDLLVTIRRPNNWGA